MRAISETAAKADAARLIANLRYQKDDYFWINDLHARMVMHPIRPDLNGKDLTAFKDPNGKALFVAFVDVVKAKGAGYVDYLWPKPGAADPVPKVSYVQGFAPWGWLIGSGIYVDDVEAQFWRDLRGTVLAVAVLVGIDLPLSSFLTVLPALIAGKWVLCDRFTDSTRAYQGFGLGVAAGTITALDALFAGIG